MFNFKKILNSPPKIKLITRFKFQQPKKVKLTFRHEEPQYKTLDTLEIENI